MRSQVVHGHVGNSAAVLPMQLQGLNIATVPTTSLSDNPHFETMRDKETIGENDILSNRDKKQHSDERVQDGYAIKTDQEQDHSANRRSWRLNSAIRGVRQPTPRKQIRHSVAKAI